jgi:hypothetical protein
MYGFALSISFIKLYIVGALMPLVDFLGGTSNFYINLPFIIIFIKIPWLFLLKYWSKTLKLPILIM